MNVELVSHRGIGKGEEITASYLSIEDLTLPGATRRKLLEDTFGFDCDCEICSPSDNLKVNRARRHREEASDHRMARYRRLFDQFGPTAHDPEHLRYWAFTMSEALTQINKAIVLLEEEHLLPEGALTAKVHVLMGWGRDRTARTVAKELHELHCLILGEEAALEEPLVKWMDDPTSCPSWKICIEVCLDCLRVLTDHRYRMSLFQMAPSMRIRRSVEAYRPDRVDFSSLYFVPFRHQRASEHVL